MIGSISSTGSQINQIQYTQPNSQLGQVAQNVKTDEVGLNKELENIKKDLKSQLLNKKQDVIKQTKENENLMETLSQDESQSLSTNVFQRTNTQANQLSGLQAYQQAGKSEFSFR